MTTPGILTSVLLFLPGCSRAPVVDLTKLPVTDQQRALTAISVSTLRDQFNRNDCEAIFRDASILFQQQRESDWMNDCENLRTQLGPWRSFAFKGSVRCGLPDAIVCTGGLAAFDKTTESIEVSWLLENGRARLFWLIVGDKMKSQIFQGSRRLFADPPRSRPSHSA
jgi:hypothetical protein